MFKRLKNLNLKANENLKPNESARNIRNRYLDQTYDNKYVQSALSHIYVESRAAKHIVRRDQRHRRNDSDDSFQSEGPATDHGSLAPTHEGRDKGAASGRSPNFAGCASKRGAVAAQGPPQLSDAGDLRRNLSVGGRGTLFAKGTHQRQTPGNERNGQPNGGNQRVQD